MEPKALPWHKITTTIRPATWAAWHLAPQRFSRRAGYHIAEVGVWRAANAESICKVFGPQLGALYLVDNYSSCPESRDPQENYVKAKEILEPYKDVCYWFLGDSVKMAKQVQDLSLDFVYIDADHSYEAVREDIIAWSPKVRPGGILGGHDIDMPDVYMAATQLFEDVRIQGGDWWAYL